MDMVVEGLRKDTFARISSNNINIRANEVHDLERFKKSWDYLQTDPYMKNHDSYRRRSFGKFTFNSSKNSIESLQDNKFFQSIDINNYAGGIERELPEMPDSISSNVILHNVIKKTLKAFLMYKNKSCNVWNIFVHQFRIESRQGKQGGPTPEGIHKYGHNFISMHMIGRHKINEGTSYIYDNQKIKKKEVTLKRMLESILLDDIEMYHSASEISSINDEEGYRDIMAIDYRERHLCKLQLQIE
ncbi:MAG TPA: 2OG-Fe dioxygenase family protein [Xylella sp.]